MALKCAVELRIPDIIHSFDGGPVTLAQIASRIPSPSRGAAYLARIMRLLSRETLYSLTPSLRWLLRGPGSELSLAPMVLIQDRPWLMSPWQCFGDCVRGSGVAFERAHGREIWVLASENAEFNQLFNDGMACTGRILVRAILEGYKEPKEGFNSIGSLVDVGGGTGRALAEIVRSYPRIKGINFDLPHVVATTPACDGVTHVGGDMFDTIPCADAVFIKWILHDWSDEDCVKILQNCRKAIPEKNGKVIIAEGDGMFDEIGLMLDLVMIAHTSGKEREELEWKKILVEGGFPRYSIIKIPSLWSIIEAYPR
ncbi:hypothetical protein NL676_000843 [Syzygium grande]|nr:hypothetical protein NL676_000843 [Syzygium grande]